MAVSVLFVCLGNICRSPTAEAATRHLIAERGLSGSIEVDSAGTGAWHAGSAPDGRSTAAAARRRIVLECSARQVAAADYDDFDLLVAMDRSNLSDLLDAAPTPEARAKVLLLLEDTDVPDPYYGGDSGFDDVLDLVEAGFKRLLDQLSP